MEPRRRPTLFSPHEPLPGKDELRGGRAFVRFLPETRHIPAADGLRMAHDRPEPSRRELMLTLAVLVGILAAAQLVML